MFGVSMWEILVVLGLLVVLVGPDRLPGLARSLGKTLGKVRRSVEDIKEQTGLDEELNFLEDLRDVGRQVSEGMAVDPGDEGQQARVAPQKTKRRKGRKKVSGPRKKAARNQAPQGVRSDPSRGVGSFSTSEDPTREELEHPTREETEGD